MDLFMENSGFSHIGEKILKLLDFETASICRLVNKSWKMMIEKVPYNLSNLLKMLKKSGRLRTAQNQVNLLPFERPDDEMWAALLTHVHFKLKSIWIDIYLQEIILGEIQKSKISKRLMSPPIEEFARIKNVKMIDFILQEHLYNFQQFNNELINAARNFRLDIARGRVNISKYFLPYIFEKLPLHVGQITDQMAIRTILLRDIMGKLSLNCNMTVDKSGNNPIHITVSRNDINNLKFFIKRKEGLTALNAKNKMGQSPLYLAVVNGSIEIVKIVAENLNEQQIMNSKCGIHLKGANVFHIAAKHGHLEILKFLATKVSNPNVSDDFGYTPIHLAAKSGHLDVVKFLASYTCEPNIANKCGVTPASLAKSHGHDEIVQFLERMSQKRKFKE